MRAGWNAGSELCSRRSQFIRPSYTSAAGGPKRSIRRMHILPRSASNDWYTQHFVHRVHRLHLDCANAFSNAFYGLSTLAFRICDYRFPQNPPIQQYFAINLRLGKTGDMFPTLPDITPTPTLIPAIESLLTGGQAIVTCIQIVATHDIVTIVTTNALSPANASTNASTVLFAEFNRPFFFMDTPFFHYAVAGRTIFFVR